MVLLVFEKLSDIAIFVKLNISHTSVFACNEIGQCKESKDLIYFGGCLPARGNNNKAR